MDGFYLPMAFRLQASIDPNQHKGLILLNSITGNALVATGLSLTNSQPMHVAIVDSSGSQITSFGGGTQYLDGGTPPAHPTGPTLEFNNGGTWATVSTANPLPVTGGGGGTQYTDGAVPPTHPIGGTIEWNDGLNGVWQTVGLSQPLPTSIQSSNQLDDISTNTNDTASNTSSLSGVIWGVGDSYPGLSTLVSVIGAVRKDTPANVSTGDGQFETLQVANGRLWTSAKIDTALPAGSNVIGHVITDTGSTTAVTGTVTVSGTITTSPPANASTNIAQINAVTPLMGNGTTGTGSLRVTIASDNTAFSVNSTLSAETTKVIGVVRNADGAGNLWTSNSSTFSAKFAQDINLLGTLGTAFSTAGKVDVILAAETTKVLGVTRTADGSGNLITSTGNALDINIKTGNPTTMTVTQATGTNLHAVIDSGTITAVTAISNALPAGSNVIGHVIADSGSTTAVTGTVTTKETKSATNTTATVASSATVVTLIASNANRLGATIYNDSTALLYVKLGATASLTDFTVLLSGTVSSIGGYYEVPFGYTGIITGIWASATGSARVGELT